MDFLALCKNLKKDFSGFPLLKIALISDVATQLVIKALKGHAYNLHLNLEVYDLGLGKSENEIYDPSSGLYQFMPDLVLFYNSLPAIQNTYVKTNAEQRVQLAATLLQKIKDQLVVLQDKGIKHAWVTTLPEVSDPYDGAFAIMKMNSFSYQVRELNEGILRLSTTDLCSVLPVHMLVAEVGYQDFFDQQLYYSSYSDISFQCLPDFARYTLAQINKPGDKIKKCIILDLDNTLWGGIAGDDGWENLEIGNLGRGRVFTDFQYWLKELKSKGILLVICSKNEEETAKEVFVKNKEMVLQLGDFVLFAANWKSKSENIDLIRQKLNISLESMVFIDDNPAEREQVKQQFPELTIPDLSKDPSFWIHYLNKLDLFSSSTLTREDSDRTALYQNQELRSNFQAGFTDLKSYLQSLQMEATFEEVNEYNLPRVAQLTQRTNQFNLRSERYTTDQLKNLLATGDYLGFAVSLSDKFGSEGIVSFVLLKKVKSQIFIDTWVMSCRVFSRGLEWAVFNHILEIAHKMECKETKAEFIPNGKNKVLEGFLEILGFEENAGFYFLELASAMVKEHQIQIITKF